MKYKVKNFSRDFSRYILQDFSYKTVALAVALVLWITLLSRKDITANSEMPIQFLTEANFEVVGQTLDKVRVDVAGPRMALKRFGQTEQLYTLDLSGLNAGTHKIRLTRDGFVVPVGVKVTSIKPDEVSVTLRQINKREE